MYSFYLIALIPVVIGAILFIKNKNVNWIEWIVGTIIAFITSGIMHGIAIHSMTADIETWSGRIAYACHHPRWVEQYQVAVYRTEVYTDSKGNMHTRQVFSHYETRHDTHPEHWVATLDFGTVTEDRGISEKLFNEIKLNFGNVIVDGGKQSYHHSGHFDGGDNNIYKAVNKTGYIYPTTRIFSFENRVKAAPTVFSFVKVPTNCPVYNWPQNGNWLSSDRLLGVKTIDIREFDCMNSRLGPTKLVNVIMVGFNSPESMLGQWQEAKWVGGKKNDLVICYGYDKTNTLWSYVFGWTEKEICKRNLETIILNNPINNDILPLIEKEIKANYVKKDWHKFDYITISPPMWAYITLISIMLVSQTIFWIFANCNDFGKK